MDIGTHFNNNRCCNYQHWYSGVAHDHQHGDPTDETAQSHPVTPQTHNNNSREC